MRSSLFWGVTQHSVVVVPTFRSNQSVLPSRVWRTGPVAFPETSVTTNVCVTSQKNEDLTLKQSRNMTIILLLLGTCCLLSESGDGFRRPFRLCCGSHVVLVQSSWIWRQHVPSKLRNKLIVQRGVGTQKTLTWATPATFKLILNFHYITPH